MANSCYSTIFVNYGDADRDILTRQLKMLKEKFHSFMVLVIVSEADSLFFDENVGLFEDRIELSGRNASEAVIEYCQNEHMSMKEATYVGVLSDGDTRLKDKEFTIKDPNEMAESYKKAMDMLQKMINPLKGN